MYKRFHRIMVYLVNAGFLACVISCPKTEALCVHPSCLPRIWYSAWYRVEVNKYSSQLTILLSIRKEEIITIVYPSLRGTCNRKRKWGPAILPEQSLTHPSDRSDDMVCPCPCPSHLRTQQWLIPIHSVTVDRCICTQPMTYPAHCAFPIDSEEFSS